MLSSCGFGAGLQPKGGISTCVLTNCSLLERTPGETIPVRSHQPRVDNSQEESKVRGAHGVNRGTLSPTCVLSPSSRRAAWILFTVRGSAVQ